MKNISVIILVSVLAFSCRHEVRNDQLFSLLSSRETGIAFNNKLTETEESNIIEYLYFNNGGGVAAGDINNDGLIDLYFTSNQNPNKLYLNKGNLKFEDITDAAGAAGSGDWKTGVTMADVNGDGYLDIYVCEVGKYKNLNGKNQLFINRKDNTFREEAHEYGLDFKGFSTQAAFFDYDGDGDLDMYLLNHSVHTNRSYGNVSLRLENDTLAGDRLYRNDEVNGKRIFHDVTKESGIYSSQIGYGLGISIADFNNDGNPDIYISNDFHENDYLYINNGNGTFSEKLTDYIAHTSRSSMGNDAGDINNDGLMDIIVLDMLPDDEKIRKQSGGEDDYDLAALKLKNGYNHQFVRNTLQLNIGGGKFCEIGLLAGIYSTDWSWSPLFCDVDNDGWKDLFITNGVYRRANDLDYVKFLTGGNRMFPSKDNSKTDNKGLYEKMPLVPEVNYIFRNNGDLTFTNMSREWGFNKNSYSNGSAYADLDNDGDEDLIVNNINAPAFIYRNNANEISGNHYISVALEGSELNSHGIGADVTLFSKGQKQTAQQYSTRGFLSSVTDKLHFGLGKLTFIDSLTVTWPGQYVQTIRNLHADTIIKLKMNEAVRKITSDKNPSTHLLFSRVSVDGLKYRHTEDDFVEFDREKLIPHSLSAEGPALAKGDINGDGMEDLFAGGASGYPGVIFIQQNNGTFKSMNLPIPPGDCMADQIDAAFFDSDGDGDQDLYIVRGGNELRAGNPLLSDILLLNDGKGNFSRDASLILSHNGSCVKPCDFDGDGDIDLFTGSRSIPGSYGLSPQQFLLENDGHGHFKDVTETRAPAIKYAGMVTSAEWFDYNKDGVMDLAIAGEWMKLRLFRNDNGNFNEVTSAAGLEQSSGWWYCLKAADVNGDGNTDLIGGNLGLNSILKTSVKEPAEMYLNDFDNNGSVDQIICTFLDGHSYPFASLDELASQMPGLENKFADYSGFGYKSVTEIFGKEAIDKSIIKSAVMAESCIFINNGNGTFSQVSLPGLAQFSVVRDVVMADCNKDGKSDLILAGNDYPVRPSYGRYDASFGWCLLSDTVNKTYKALLPVESGLSIEGDARKIISIYVKGKHFLVAAVNNGELQIFEFLK